MKRAALYRTSLVLVTVACTSKAGPRDGPLPEEVEADAPAAAAPDARAVASPADATVRAEVDAAAGNAMDTPPPPPSSPPSSPDAARDTIPDAATAAAPVLTSTGFLMKGGDLIFPASASYPMDQSPPFAWSGAPAGTRSFALTFVDRSNGATKWVVWDIPATVPMLPGNLSKTVHPAEVPQASQRGSLGRTGYSGPGVPGPPLHVYEFVLWALDTEKLPGTDGLTTATLRERVLPMHRLAASAPLVAKGQEGGP